MLKAVSVTNVAVIKKLCVDFDRGFTVITGETGAGKSILIDCISFVLGSRASKDMIRTGESRAEVSAVFDVDGKCAERLLEFGVEPDENGELSLVRYITDDGKSSAKINGRAVPISTLRNASGVLIAIHGQQDSFVLSEKNELLAMLDGYIGMESEIENYSVSYEALSQAEQRLASLKESLKDRAMMLDILEYQDKEISGAKLHDPDEEDRLLKMRIKFRSLEKVSKNVSLVTRALVDNETGVTASYMIERAASALRGLSDVMPDAEEKAARLDEIKYELSDISESASDLISDDDLADPEKKLDAVEKRLTLIKKLRAKYGDSISEIIAKHEDIKRRISDLKGGDDALADLTNEIGKLRRECEVKADVLSEKRHKSGDALTKEISKVLTTLDMPKVCFKIAIDKQMSDGEIIFDKNGYDDVDFLVSANVGEDLQPISHIASGGELSRIMLAIKSSMQSKSGEATSIFDEIDAGVSGGTSERIGRKLLSMSKSSQIICVTHSAQIASLADTHLKISKHEVSDRVESYIESLDADGRVKELSRIIGGVKITQKVIDTAEEMLKKAND